SYRYVSFLFQNIDRQNTGIITFEEFVITLSLLIHGTIEDRLSWELAELIASVFNLIVPGRKLNIVYVSNSIEQRTNELFEKWDVSQNGLISLNDFLTVCLQDEAVIKSMNSLNSDIFL
ncbi:unnamed protein product, partial [Didymodactylos carnosus]